METSAEQITQPFAPYNPGILGKIFAWFLSIVFHPLFIPVIGVAGLAYTQEGYYLGMSTTDKNLIILRVAVNTIFFPLITVLLLKALGFIKSIYLRTKRERIIPYIAGNIFYFWMFLVFHNQPDVPPITTSFILGIFLASSLALVLNSFFKISMHALGMGAILGLVLIIIYTGNTGNVFLTMMIVLLITGLVCTSRLMISDHTYGDLVSGLAISILSQIIAIWFVLYV